MIEKMHMAFKKEIKLTTRKEKLDKNNPYNTTIPLVMDYQLYLLK